MAADLAPKITDLKNLQDLSKIFALPMLAVAYIMQTGLVVSFDEFEFIRVNWEGSLGIAWFQTFWVVVLKTLWMALWGAIFNGVIGLLHTNWNELVYPLSGMCFFTLGLLGLFPPKEVLMNFSSVNNFWFYACFVWGFFCIAMDNQHKKT